MHHSDAGFVLSVAENPNSDLNISKNGHDPRLDFFHEVPPLDRAKALFVGGELRLKDLTLQMFLTFLGQFHA